VIKFIHSLPDCRAMFEMVLTEIVNIVSRYCFHRIRQLNMSALRLQSFQKLVNDKVCLVFGALDRWIATIRD